jgi:hypothetical protein
MLPRAALNLRFVASKGPEGVDMRFRESLLEACLHIINYIRFFISIAEGLHSNGGKVPSIEESIFHARR